MEITLRNVYAKTNYKERIYIPWKETKDLLRKHTCLVEWMDSNKMNVIPYFIDTHLQGLWQNVQS